MAETDLPNSGDITQGPYGRRRKWFAIIEGDTARVPLTRGLFATVDLADLPLVTGHSWAAISGPNTHYAASREGHGVVLMHVLIAGISPPLLTDHESRDGLNNRRSNLRPGTKAQNAMNRVGWGGVPFKGVTFHKASGLYQARITVNRKQVALGCHATPEAAARAYDDAARKHFGEFALTNEELGAYG